MTNYRKNRVLTLYKILIENTDEKHQITMKKILSLMEEAGCPCSDDSIRRYIDQLMNDFGVDVIYTRGRNASYFVGERLLQKEELKLIIDSINASNFIEKGIAKNIIDKLKSTMSIYDSDELDRTVLGINVAKAENKQILYNVNKIQEALKKGVQITFDYMKWNKNKKLVKKRKKRYRMNPWALIWANDRYYLYGYDVEETNGVLKERNYRVDKIHGIEISIIPRNGEEQFKSFDANTYVSRRIGMFQKEEKQITVRIPEYLIGAFIDQFGKEIAISQENDDKLLVTFWAACSSNLLGWLLGLNDVEVLQPDDVLENMKRLLMRNIDFYLEDEKKV